LLKGESIGNEMGIGSMKINEFNEVFEERGREKR
jgi:hypothetical protein